MTDPVVRVSRVPRGQRGILPSMRRVLVLGFWLSAAVSSEAVSQIVITVDQGGNGDHTEIQAAIDAAGEGDTVLVKSGDYEVTKPLTFLGKAIRVKGEKGPGETTVRMSRHPANSSRGGVVIFESGEGAGSVLEGFTVTGGTTGGVYFSSSSPRLETCIITANSVIGGGGGIYCTGNSSPTLTHCTIAGNWAQADGGGAFCVDSSPTFMSCTIAGNRANRGGAVSCADSSPTLTNCTVSGNHARTDGGGLFCQRDSSPTLTNCAIWGNRADNLGGGVAFYRTSSTLINCTISGNRATSSGGGLYCLGPASPRLTNCILWANAPEWICGQLLYSLIDEDPLFVEPGLFRFDRWVTANMGGKERKLPDFVVEEPDYRLRRRSLGIDTGTPDDAPEVDIEGNPRPCGAGVDLGAYESGNCRPADRFLRGDCDGDGLVNMSDAIVLLRFNFVGGPEPPCLAACDADGDGRVIGIAADAIYTLNHNFAGGPEPVLPFPRCGAGELPTDETLGCENPSETCTP